MSAQRDGAARSCADCIFYEPHNTRSGECRRQPPRVLHPGTEGCWPLVSAEDWCGGHATEWPASGVEAAAAAARAYLGSVAQLAGLGPFGREA